MPLEHHLFFFIGLVFYPLTIDEAGDGIDDASYRSIVIIFVIGHLILLLLNILAEVTSSNQDLDLILELKAFFDIMAIVMVEAIVLPPISPIRKGLHWLRLP